MKNVEQVYTLLNGKRNKNFISGAVAETLTKENSSIKDKELFIELDS